MRSLAVASFLAAFLAVTVGLKAQEPPKMPAPEKEHGWLEQLVGDWTTEMVAASMPGQPATEEKCNGTESVRSVGGFWTLSEFKGTMPGGMPMSGVMTLGYDAQKKKYIGTWVDSSNSHMWHYLGTLDPAGKVLTLEAEGPDMMTPGKMAKYRDVIEIKGKSERTLTSSMQGGDGKWTPMMTLTAKRK